MWTLTIHRNPDNFQSESLYQTHDDHKCCAEDENLLTRALKSIDVSGYFPAHSINFQVLKEETKSHCILSLFMDFLEIKEHGI